MKQQNNTGQTRCWKYQIWYSFCSDANPGAQMGGAGLFPCCMPRNKVSLNYAFLVRHISEGPTCNRCHVTAINMIGWMTPNLDAEVFCCKMWSKIAFYLNKHEIWPKNGILSQWWLHTILKKTSKGAFSSIVLQLKIPCVWLFRLNHWMKAGFKPNNVALPILNVHCLSHIFQKLLWPKNTKNIATRFIE